MAGPRLGICGSPLARPLPWQLLSSALAASCGRAWPSRAERSWPFIGRSALSCPVARCALPNQPTCLYPPLPLPHLSTQRQQRTGASGVPAQAPPMSALRLDCSNKPHPISPGAFDPCIYLFVPLSPSPGAQFSPCYGPLCVSVCLCPTRIPLTPAIPNIPSHPLATHLHPGWLAAPPPRPALSNRTVVPAFPLAACPWAACASVVVPLRHPPHTAAQGHPPLFFTPLLCPSASLLLPGVLLPRYTRTRMPLLLAAVWRPGSGGAFQLLCCGVDALPLPTLAP